MQLTSPHSLITAVALHCTAIMENGMTRRLSQHAAGPEPLSLQVTRRDCLCTRCDALLLRVIRVEESCEILYQKQVSDTNLADPENLEGNLATLHSELIHVRSWFQLTSFQGWFWEVHGPGWWFQPLWKILISWDDYFQYMEKQNVPNHQPVDPWSFWPIFQQSLLSSGVIHVPVSPSLHR